MLHSMLTEGTRYFIGASRASHSKWSMPSLQPSLASLSQILPKLHDENILDDGDMHYMYDRAYGNVEFGKVKGMTPYYKLLNQLFCYTIAPTSGDADNISNLSKNLLARMAPNQGQFSIFDFIWEEIIVCSVSPKKGCHYAPYIFHMITEVTGVDILTDKGHQVYKPSKGTLERLLKVGSHAIPQAQPGPANAPPQAPPQAPSSSHRPSIFQGPSSSHGPSSSQGPPRAPKKKGILRFISQVLFACFNIGRHNAEEMHAHRQYVDEQLLKIEARQKEIMAKQDMPHSPLRAPMDFPPPPTFYNPWEQMGGPSMMYGAPPPAFDDIEEALGGHGDSADEDDVPAANTPSDEAVGDEDDE